MQALDIEDKEVNRHDSDDPPKEEQTGFTKLIVILCLFNILLKASYSVCAPFLPTEANKKGVDQAVVGILF